jgi:HSP20 family protein
MVTNVESLGKLIRGKSMDRERNRGLTPKSLWRWPSFIPSMWEDVEDKMSQWIGTESDISVSEDDKNIYVEAHMPGLSSKDIDVSLNNNTLWISGERREEEKDRNRRFYRQSKRSFNFQVELPGQVEENTEQAEYKDGILKITFAKKYESNMKKIAVKGSTSNHNENQNQTQQKK